MVAPVVAGIASFLGRTVAWSAITKFGGSIFNLAKSKVGRGAINASVIGAGAYAAGTGIGAGASNFRTGIGMNEIAETEAETDNIDARRKYLEESKDVDPGDFNVLPDYSNNGSMALKDIAITGGLLVVAIAGAYFIVNGKK